MASIKRLVPRLKSISFKQHYSEMVQDIKKSFAIAEDINVLDEEIDMTDEEIVEEIAKMAEILNEKPCDCGNNPDGKCKCND